ncbi:MAG: peptide chain release factor N(5)-glutamine methyltransferase, partial [Alphaproteobacteria bacterium]
MAAGGGARGGDLSAGAEPTVGRAVDDAADLLARAGSESPGLDAELLMGAALGASRALVVAERRSPLAAPQAAAFAALVDRRRRREPMAYVLGTREFWSLDFAVDPRVLVPRPETERL